MRATGASVASARQFLQATGAGSFANAFTRGSFEISAHSDLDGSNPHGNAGIMAEQEYPFPNYSARGPVTCLAVAGKRAAIGIKVAAGDVGGTDVTGQGIILIVEDKGAPGQGTPDEMTNTGFYPNGDQLDCWSVLFQPSLPVTDGNVVVK
ncbi:MAG TPA: hypothetical protein VJ867_11270 [Gemmatimonadaceae bacterium]|nr:hypothetical protein [Gemmatimonadaceae bacterium]